MDETESRATNFDNHTDALHYFLSGSTFSEDQISRKLLLDNILCFKNGTIFYGTIFSYNKHRLFNIEDIFYYKNTNISTYSNLRKLSVLEEIFQNTKICDNGAK